MAERIDGINVSETSVTGCPDPTGGRAIVVPGGPTQTIVPYELRDSTGAVVDLSSYTTLPAGVIVYFSDIFCPEADIISAEANVVNNKVNIKIPGTVSQRPGIYSTEIWIVSNVEDSAATAVYRDTTITSVESSLLLRAAHGVVDPGPLTLNQIRLQLRDFPGVNEYWQQHEFSVAEIVNSMILPIQVWNSTPPAVTRYNATTFPYRYEWLEAVTANLLKTASMWLLRNARTIKYADGTTESDKDKYVDYLKISEVKWNAYLDFCRNQKAAINLRFEPGVH